MTTTVQRTKQTITAVTNGQKTQLAGLVQDGDLLSFWYFVKFPCGGWVDFDVRYFGADNDTWLEKARGSLAHKLQMVADLIKDVDAFSIIRTYKASSER